MYVSPYLAHNAREGRVLPAPKESVFNDRKDIYVCLASSLSCTLKHAIALMAGIVFTCVENTGLYVNFSFFLFRSLFVKMGNTSRTRTLTNR